MQDESASIDVPLVPATNWLLIAVGVIGITQAIVGQFVSQGVPLFLRSAGQPSQVVGLVFLASLPYILKILWAPLVDRWKIVRFGHFRSWVIFSQIVSITLIAGLFFVSPKDSPYALITLALLIMTALATQETAISGLMVRLVAANERAKFSAVRAAANGAAAAIVGFGAIYILADFGWQIVITALGVFVTLLALICVTFQLDRGSKTDDPDTENVGMFRLFRDPRARWLLLVKTLGGLGVGISFGLKSILLIDAGLSVSEAGLVSLVASGAIGILTALITFPLVRRLGGYVMLGGVGLAIAGACGFFAYRFSIAVTDLDAIAFVLLTSALLYAAYPPSRAILMSYCGTDRAATDFSAFVSAEGALVLVVAAVGVGLVDVVGIPLLLTFAAIGTLFGSALALRLRDDDLGRPK
ncbi:MAG: MFS transporter [Pseudomonadota bacterium]